MPASQVLTHEAFFDRAAGPWEATETAETCEQLARLAGWSSTMPAAERPSMPSTAAPAGLWRMKRRQPWTKWPRACVRRGWPR
jgi:hypothetical protein